LQNIHEGLVVRLVCNNGFRPEWHHPAVELLKAYSRTRHVTYSLHFISERSISTIKYKCLCISRARFVVLLDEDTVLLKAKTLSNMRKGVQRYNADAISPLGFEVDKAKPVLNEFATYYKRTQRNDADKYFEGRIALGMCMGLTAKGRKIALTYWLRGLPYLEDQVIAHFVKRYSNYLYCSDPVVHLASSSDKAYVCDDDEVTRYLQKLAVTDPDYEQLYCLRKAHRDGAQFRKPVALRRIGKGRS
jgi:hypothetical protein